MLQWNKLGFMNKESFKLHLQLDSWTKLDKDTQVFILERRTVVAEYVG